MKARKDTQEISTIDQLQLHSRHSFSQESGEGRFSFRGELSQIAHAFRGVQAHRERSFDIQRRFQGGAFQAWRRNIIDVKSMVIEEIFNAFVKVFGEAFRVVLIDRGDV